MQRDINFIQLFLFDRITAADGIECNALLCQQTNKCIEYFKHSVCSIFFNYHLADTIHMIRHFSHSMTNRFAHSATNYRYQFKFLQCHTIPMLLPCQSFAKCRCPYIASCTTLCSRVLLPIYCFPSALLRKNRVEMALNYTNPIEFATPRSSVTYILKHSSNRIVA